MSSFLAHPVFTHPLFAIAITLVLYFASLKLQDRYTWAHPMVSASVALVLCLFLMKIPYASYHADSSVFTWLLGPATVALGVPMYKQGVLLKRNLRRLMIVVLAGSIVGMLTAGGVAWLCGASHQVVLSTLSKSVTTPIAVQVSEQLHGDPMITAAMVLISGLLGSVIGPPVLRLARILHDHAIGSAIGTSSHALGTASLFRTNEVQGSVSSLAMAMAGVITAVLATMLSWYWR